jgi:hypothetical protein
MKICGLLLGAAIFLTACSGDEPSRPQVPDTPQLVLEALEKAYRKRDAAAYARLLADDFRFFFDEETRLSFELPDSWNRDDDVKATSRIFRDDFVDEITIQLEGGSPVPSGESGRETWLRNHVADTFLEIEMEPDDQEPDGLTLLLDGHVQTFYFRMGKYPADTLATSETAARMYLVEWHDRGIVRSPGGNRGDEDALPVYDMTWSAIKLFF